MTVYKGLASFELVVVVTTQIDRRASWESYRSLLRSTLKLTSGSRTFGDSSVYCEFVLVATEG